MWISREDHQSLVTRNARLEEQVSHLGQMLDKAEKVITVLEVQVERERSRAENATDNLLTHVAKVPGITDRTSDMPDPDDIHDIEDPEELASLQRDINYKGIVYQFFSQIHLGLLWCHILHIDKD